MPFDLGPGALIWMAVAVFGAAFVRGYSGFGFSAMVVAASSLVTNPLNFVAVVVILETVMSLQAAKGAGPDVDWRRVWLLLAGAAVGLPLGLWVLTGVSEATARAVVSGYVLAMCAVLFRGWRLGAEVRGPVNLAAGIVSGLANAPGMGGLPVAAFFAAQPMPAAVFRATLIAYFPLLDLYSAPLYWWAGLVSWDTAWAALIALPLTASGQLAWRAAFLRHRSAGIPPLCHPAAGRPGRAGAGEGAGRVTILVVNAGSSSLKLALFDGALAAAGSVAVTEIGGAARLDGAACDAADHAAALTLGLRTLGVGPGDLAAAAHRVVHGGPDLAVTCRITAEVEAAIAAAVPLAPLHNPPALGAIRALAALVPNLPQCASFDTAFHATNPEVARRYALPPEAEALGLRRYGFHGLSYASLVARLPAVSGRALPRRLLALHLGNGASLCAIRDGRSVATTMGWSPLDGLTMGTRAGGIDGNAVLRLAEVLGIEGAGRVLNRESGLLGLGGASDMRALHAAGTPEARFAVAHFCYWAVRHAGSMIAAMGGLDAVAFTGGIGENDAHVRAAILSGLDWAGVAFDRAANERGAVRLHESDARVAVWIVTAAEERHIAAEALRVLDGAEER